MAVSPRTLPGLGLGDLHAFEHAEKTNMFVDLNGAIAQKFRSFIGSAGTNGIDTYGPPNMSHLPSGTNGPPISTNIFRRKGTEAKGIHTAFGWKLSPSKTHSPPAG